MDYEGFFRKRLGVLHAEGRYRIFADLEQHCRSVPTPDIADVQTREYWRCRPSLATHFCFAPIARTAPALAKNLGVAS